MKKVLIAMMLAAFAMGSAAYADEHKTLTPQQQKMKDCNAEAKAKELKKQARKDFMKVCLSGKTGEAASEGAAAAVKVEVPAATAEGAVAVEKKPAQQTKMKTCNADAKEKGLKGQERKDFMKACLSG